MLTIFVTIVKMLTIKFHQHTIANVIIVVCGFTFNDKLQPQLLLPTSYSTNRCASL